MWRAAEDLHYSKTVARLQETQPGRCVGAGLRRTDTMKEGALRAKETIHHMEECWQPFLPKGGLLLETQILQAHFCVESLS